ncbi:MAG: hypothetical protein HY898_01100 [Deltaproteobacteria bacterium]|nr:hypothetical protein [Deltaproteobacteria bacterium]
MKTHRSLSCCLVLGSCLAVASCGASNDAQGPFGSSGSAGAGGSPPADGAAGQDSGAPDSKLDVSQGDAGSAGSQPGDASVEPATDAGSDATTEPPVCQPVQAAAPVDPWQTRVPGAGFGGIVTATTGGHNDVFLQSPAPNPDYIRVGARLDWGGSVVFFGLSANAFSNTIDANDTGRELQIALYDPTRAMQGCAWNASCQSTPTSCPNSISYLGWDPVQGGDKCGHGSPSTWSQAGDALRLTAHPLQWNPDWNKPDCSQTPCGASGVPVEVTYIIDFRFVSTHVVEVAVEITSQETIDHPSTGQEFPTLYVANGNKATDLPLLLDASGNQVSLNTPGNDGFFYDNFSSPGPWVTWQNATKDYGVALAMDQGILQWQGWRGNGQTAPYFHNVRPILSFGLKAGKSVRGISYLVLGSYSTVQAQIQSVLGSRPPFGSLDTPPAGGSASVAPGQDLPIAGWVLDTAHLGMVHVEVDNVAVLDIPVNAARADVCEAFPAYDGCPNVGFAGNLSTAGWDACPHLVRVTAKDADNNTSVLGESVVTVVP